MIKSTLKILVLLTAVSLVALWLPHPVQAAPPDRLIVGGNYTLEDGETLNEDLLVIGGRVILEDGSELNGDILMVGGSLEIAGEINGDIVVAGGLLDITETAVIAGDITSAGANVQRDPEAVIEGDITTEQEGPFIVTPIGVRLPQINTAIAPSFGFLGFILRVILWALLAMLLALFLPNQLSRTARTAISQPIISGGLGLLTAIVLPIMLVIIALTILLIPVSLIGIFLLILAWAFGLIALGTELGQRIAGIFKAQWHPALAAGAGTFFLILVINGIESAIPCLGWLPKIIVGVLGLGAVMLTRFGLQAYPSAEPEVLQTMPEVIDPL
jgi:hypothetical protein